MSDSRYYSGRRRGPRALWMLAPRAPSPRTLRDEIESAEAEYSDHVRLWFHPRRRATLRYDDAPWLLDDDAKTAHHRRPRRRAIKTFDANNVRVRVGDRVRMLMGTRIMTVRKITRTAHGGIGIWTADDVSTPHRLVVFTTSELVKCARGGFVSGLMLYGGLPDRRRISYTDGI